MAESHGETRVRILDAAFPLFRQQGFARVSVDAIAERAGVTKRTVYYHFASKDDIIAEVLEVQHRHMLSQYQGWMDPCDTTSAAKIASLFAKLKDWADRPDWLGSGFSRIAAELADMRGHPARAAASKHKAGIEAWLAGQFDDIAPAGARDTARQIMILIEGGMSLALIHGDTGYIASAGDASMKLITSPES